MVARTSNSIEIRVPRPFVFQRTNDLAAWTELFTEYARVEILEQQDNHFVFRLTTHPNEDGKSWSWTSWRHLYPEEWRIEAARIAPLVPFSAMSIRWYYDAPDEKYTVMRWEQEFSVAASAGFSEEDATAYINNNTKIQMQVIKERLEASWERMHSQNGAELWAESPPAVL